ncbi:MAG TPA: hypothetical protein VGO09_06030 [Flavisolibacter sp.]|nr:hypothetical protein [Flavisolibacter sp.]
MRNPFTFLLLLFSLSSLGQGPQQLVSVPNSAWSSTVKGWLYLPADYQTSAKQYPVVFFYHGVGEAGTDPMKLLNQGLPQLIANGMRPDNIINPSDGLYYSFIVLSVQDQYWSPDPAWLPYELAWLKNNYRIDTNRVYVTGLSAGGASTFGVAINADNISSLISAAAPMSPAGVSTTDSTSIQKYKIRTWFFCGDHDEMGFLPSTKNYNAICNRQYNGSSNLTIYPGGHCCWDSYYDVNWRDASSGLSVWQWLLTNAKQLPEPLPIHFKSIRLITKS